MEEEMEELYVEGVATQGPGIVAFAHVSASARARAGSAAWCRRPAAMLSHPAMRSRLMATLRQVAMTRGACPVRTWDWSSAKLTSRTQWRRFSTPQWPRTQAASVAAGAAV